MVFICYREGSRSWTRFIVKEFGTERKALNWLKGKASTRVIGIFNGKRLEPVIGERKVVKKGIVKFQEFEEKEEKNE